MVTTALLEEQTLTFAQARRFLPGSPPNQTLRRWAIQGVDGVKLETVKVGGRRFTSKEAIDRFLTRLNAGEIA